MKVLWRMTQMIVRAWLHPRMRTMLEMMAWRLSSKRRGEAAFGLNGIVIITI